MSVPTKDTLCRFIDPDKWNDGLQQPTSRAFKQAGLSVWHPGRLDQCNVRMEDLLIEHLTGWGQAYHTVDDYVRFAYQVAQSEGVPCRVQVEWRPDEVDAPWQEWGYAHVQVEATEGDKDLHLELRRLLAANSRRIVPPTTSR